MFFAVHILNSSFLTPESAPCFPSANDLSVCLNKNIDTVHPNDTASDEYKLADLHGGNVKGAPGQIASYYWLMDTSLPAYIILASGSGLAFWKFM